MFELGDISLPNLRLDLAHVCDGDEGDEDGDLFIIIIISLLLLLLLLLLF